MSPVVAAVVAVNVVVFVASGFGTGSLVERWGMWPIGVEHGEWYRLLTAAFLHANVLHIAFNMWALVIFGPPVERAVGRVRFGGLYLLAALGGSVCSYLVSPIDTLSVGASGAIFGLMGAYFVLARRYRLPTAPVVFLVVVNLVIGFTGGIDWHAHIGGLVVGGLVSLGFVVGDDRTTHEVRRLASAAVCAAVLLGLGLVSQLPPGHVNLPL